MLSSFRAVSVFDIPHIFVANAVYVTPFKPGQGALSAILGDITISPIITLRSGLPFSVRLPNTTNKINGQTLDSNYAIPFFSSRDNNRGAGFASWDMSIQKAIYINRDRGVRLNLIAQATNLLNRINFNHVNDAFDVNGIGATGTVQTARRSHQLDHWSLHRAKGCKTHQRKPTDHSLVLFAGGRAAAGAVWLAVCFLAVRDEEAQLSSPRKPEFGAHHHNATASFFNLKDALHARGNRDFSWLHRWWRRRWRRHFPG